MSVSERVPVLLVSTYESGFQSLGVAVAAAHLREANVAADTIDLSLEPIPTAERLASYGMVGFHLPMFHSVPTAVKVAAMIRGQAAHTKVFFFGLYADLFRDELLGKYGDYVLGTDWEDHLSRLVTGGAAEERLVALGKQPFVRQRTHRVPARDALAPLSRFAKLIDEDGDLMAASVEATRGCAHHCTHCPIPPVYGGKVTMIPAEVVLADIDNLVRMGARHVSFVDPDFLNVPRHSLEIVTEMHRRYPFLTYDFVAKVSHFRKHEDALRQLAPMGLRFVLTAMEFNDDGVLDILKKKHDADDLDWALRTFRELRVHLKPTFVFVNPWVSPQDIMDLMDFIETRDLIDAVDPVQYKIRLVLFNNSLLFDNVGLSASLADKGRFYTEWQHKDPAVEKIYREVCAAVDAFVEQGKSAKQIFHRVKAIVAEHMRKSDPGRLRKKIDWGGLPALGECPRFNVPNYCCTEPTSGLEELKGMI